MKEYTTKFVRNIALIGHGSAGKTTLTEAILFLTKAINRRGTVEEGNTVTDFDKEEIRRTISLSSALAPVEWGEYKINILDTPGYTDFIGEVKSALRVVEIALSVVDAAAGVEVGTELTWVYADEEQVPHAVLINKMDRENANYERTLTSLKDAFDARFLSLMLPIGAESNFQGVVNILERKAYIGTEGVVVPIPADLADQVEDLYNQVVEAAVESDEALMEKYFDDVPLTPEEIAGGLKQVIAEGSYIPVLVGAGGSELIGLSVLLNMLTLITPSPDQMTFRAKTVQGEEEFAISDTSPLALLVFKTLADPYVGKQTFFRIYGGVVNSGNTVFNERARTQERLGQLYTMLGKEQIPLDTAHAGDIAVVAKMAEALTNDTLCDKGMPLTLRGVTLPDAIYSIAVSPVTKQDTAKMGTTLSRICEEDPTLRWRQDPATHETILSGMGEAHVDTAIRRMKSRFNVGLESRAPKVPYQETVTRKASSQYRHKKQSGGAGQFAEVHMRVEPVSRDVGFDYVWEVVGGRISSSFRPSIEKGIKQVLPQGVLAGYPIRDSNRLFLKQNPCYWNLFIFSQFQYQMNLLVLLCQISIQGGDGFRVWISRIKKQL